MGASIIDNGTVRVIIQGKKHVVEELDPSAVSAYVSVRGGNAAVFSVPVQLQLPEGITQVADVYVRVSLTNTQPETTREPQSETPEPDTTSTVNIPEPTTTSDNPTTPSKKPEDDTTTMPENSSQTQET